MRAVLRCGKVGGMGQRKVASNFAVANAPDAIVLPSLRYGLHPERRGDDYVFLPPSSVTIASSAAPPATRPRHRTGSRCVAERMPMRSTVLVLTFN